MSARRRRAGCGGGPKGRAGRRRRLSSPEPRARAAPWPGPRAARGGAAGGRRGPAGAGAGAAAAASRGSPGRSAAARTLPARGERSCCSSPGLWVPFRCAAGRRRRRPSESWERRRLEDRRCRRRLRATGPKAPPVAAPSSAPRGGSERAGEEIRGGRALRRETDPRRQLERHASLGLKKDKPNQKGASFYSFLSAWFQFLLRLLFPLPLEIFFFFLLGLRVMG